MFLSVLIFAAGDLYICSAYMCLCVCLLGIHTQPCYWLDLGTWSCSSLAYVRLLDLATPNDIFAQDQSMLSLSSTLREHSLSSSCSRHDHTRQNQPSNITVVFQKSLRSESFAACGI